MANDGIKITAPINTDDVGTVLGVSSHDVGYLCSNAHGKINKWAKFKPVKKATLDTVNTGSVPTYKGEGTCGVTPPAYYTSRQSLINGLSTNGFEPWTYNPPTGGANEPFRLTDFDGYNHKSTSPFPALPTDTLTYVIGDGYEIEIPMVMPLVDAETELTIDDITPDGTNYKDWYAGVLLHSSSNNYIATTAKTINNSGLSDWSVKFGNGTSTSGNIQLATGTYQAYPFLSNKQWKVASSDPSSVNMMGIERAGLTVRLLSQTDAYKCEITWKYTTTTTIKWYIKITNNTSKKKTFTSAYLQANTTSSNTSGTTANLSSFGTLEVEANASIAKSGTTTGVASNFNFVRFYATNFSSAWIAKPLDQNTPIPDA